MTNGQTHATSGITSVQEIVNDPMHVGPLLLGMFGCAVGGQGTAATTIVGLIILAGAVFWWVSQKVTYTVAIRTSAGELKALKDTNGERVQKIVQALNEAMLYRN